MDEQLTENNASASEFEDNEENVSAKYQKRGKYHRNYSVSDLENAVSREKSSEITAYAASKLFSISYKTLSYRLKLKNQAVGSGRVPVLSPEIESELALWLIDCAEFGDPRTREELVNAAAELSQLSLDEKKHFKNETPSASWVKSFLSRNKNVSFCTSSALTIIIQQQLNLIRASISSGSLISSPVASLLSATHPLTPTPRLNSDSVHSPSTSVAAVLTCPQTFVRSQKRTFFQEEEPRSHDF